MLKTLKIIKNHIQGMDCQIFQRDYDSIDYTSGLNTWAELPRYVKEEHLHVIPNKGTKQIDKLQKILHSLAPPELKFKPQISSFQFLGGRLYYGSIEYIQPYNTGNLVIMNFPKEQLETLIKIILYPNKETLEKVFNQSNIEFYSIYSVKLI